MVFQLYRGGQFYGDHRFFKQFPSNVYQMLKNKPGGPRGRDCMVVGFPTTCASSAYHH